MILLNLPLDKCKFKESTQWYSNFDVATAIATVVYSQKVTKNGDQYFIKYKRHLVGRLLRHTQLDN